MEKFVFRGLKMPVKAQTIGEELTRMYEENDKTLTPKIVLNKAKKKRHVLHNCFEWNDVIAANNHRIDQAKYLIRNISIVKENNAGEAITVRSFVSIRLDEKGELTHHPFAKGKSIYVSIIDAFEDDDLRAYTLDSALLDLRTWKQKYQELKELGKLFTFIEEEVL